MLRGTNVSDMMGRVEGALLKARRSSTGPEAVIYLTPDDRDRPLAGLRSLANIQTEFYSGSGRPVVGPSIRFAKRAVRRFLRWYVGPMMEQQTRFNQAAVDEIERLRQVNERLSAELEALLAERPGGGI